MIWANQWQSLAADYINCLGQIHKGGGPAVAAGDFFPC